MPSTLVAPAAFEFPSIRRLKRTRVGLLSWLSLGATLAHLILVGFFGFLAVGVHPVFWVAAGFYTGAVVLDVRFFFETRKDRDKD